MHHATVNASFQDAPSLLRVFDTARRFVAYREREAALANGKLPAPRTLSEAIDRDFLAFELRRAERDLRDAVIMAEPDLAFTSDPDTASISASPNTR